MEKKMSPHNIAQLPRWRIDNLYGFLVSIGSMVVLLVGLYYGIINNQNLQNQKMDYIIQQVTEIKQIQKERIALEDNTRNRVTALEIEVKNLTQR